MKAAVYHRYGPPEVLAIEEVEKPTPKDNEILVKVHATSVTPADWRFRQPDPFIVRAVNGLFKPKNKVMGTELSGEVVALGQDVVTFKTGDQIIADTVKCGFGAHAEYKCLPADGMIVLKPDNLTFDEAAAGICFGALSALFFLRDKGNIQSGHKVLINGASGGVGTFAVQLAKYFGAEVTGVCSTRNIELVKSLGADHVIDYTKDDFTQSKDAYDIIFDTVGKVTFSDCKGSLKKQGVFLALVFGVRLMAKSLWTSIFGGKKAIGTVALGTQEDLLFIKELVEKGKIKPVIDRRYTLDQIVEAHTYAQQGHKTGSVVITMGE